ncbi:MULTISPECIES: murein transglycosylase domain-containing protein [Idiomarina]|jgi:membrane-bound lytic murein transglycosylase C|nr:MULTISPECIES: murein transglycosylase domain-containing protein [Idiomarina]MBE91581.1 lytic murein transglycosylase [Idiomarina sp.]MBH93567.1 lytic murein transglycosylase [Idiomarina sp.]|tara:strand:+ start:113518 stop:114708 length:1191 start_codon:yes stop_codon:yes gene_type:complete
MNKKTQIITLMVALTTTIILAGCEVTPNNVRRVVTSGILSGNDPTAVVESLARERLNSYRSNPRQLISDIEDLRKALRDLRTVAEAIWGEEKDTVPSEKKYVKYSDNFHAKAVVDFEQGLLTVATLHDSNNPAETRQKLQAAIVRTLLTPADLTAVDIFTDKEPEGSGKPFLRGQVVDQDNVVVEYQWRAKRFAEYLVNNKLRTRRAKDNDVYEVQIALVDDHKSLRKHQYSDYVIAAAKRYDIEPELIYAIIETESSFNPYAVSHANAYGLMQVVAATAGRDVFERVREVPGQPTSEQLFDPAQNIDIGSAYLYILNTQYLKGVRNPSSREYAIVSAYNGGAGNVLKTFSSNRNRAIQIMNRSQPGVIYRDLTSKHPLAESRRYLEKVMYFKQNY